MKKRQQFRHWFSCLSRRARILCVVAPAVLVAIPLVITAARASTFSASVQAFPIEQPRVRPIRNTAAYVRRLLRDPVVFQGTTTTAGFPVEAGSLPSAVRVTPLPDGALITARADSPDHARLLANAVAGQVANASARDLVLQTRTELARLRESVTSERDSVRRAQLLATRAEFQSDLARTRFALAMGPRPEAPRPSGMVDRALEWLPGPLPPRPNSGWIALVGLAVTALVWTAVLLYAAPPRDEPRVGAWLLPLSRDERADLLTFTQKFGNESEEELALTLVKSKDRDARHWQNIVQEFAMQFPPTRKRFRVLLFGCGAGDEALLLADAGYEVTMLDADPTVLEFVEHRLRRRDLSAATALIDPRRPTIDGVFDGIFVRELSANGLNRSLAAQALREALRPGAMLVEKRAPSTAAPPVATDRHLRLAGRLAP